VEELSFVKSSPQTARADSPVPERGPIVSQSVAEHESDRFQNQDVSEVSQPRETTLPDIETPHANQNAIVAIDELQVVSRQMESPRRKDLATRNQAFEREPGGAFQSNEQVETIENIFESPFQPRAGDLPEPLEQESFISIAPANPEPTMHDYIREVSAWIAAKPETSDTETDTMSELETPRDVRTLIVSERQKNKTAPARDSEPEFDDVSLSIGTISIVIEEPKPSGMTSQPTAVVLPVAQPFAQEGGREPTSLSRYYLRL
jgi:hypothetical protein